MRDRSHDDAIAELYRKKPSLAREVINGILEDGEPEELLVVLRQMTKAFGGMKGVAKQSELNATQLYRTLSAEGNPTLNSLAAVLKAMKLRLAVVPLGAAKKRSRGAQQARQKPKVAA